MAPTIVPAVFMPNTRGLLKSGLGRPGGIPRSVSTPLHHAASEIEPSELAIPPATTPLLLKASPPVSENGMKGRGVTSYRSAARPEDMMSRCRCRLEILVAEHTPGVDVAVPTDARSRAKSDRGVGEPRGSR